MTAPISGRPNAVAPLPAGTNLEPTGDVTVGGAEGIRVDQHRVARRVLTTLGVAGLGAGGAFFGAQLLGKGGAITARAPWAMPVALGALALGALGIGVAQGAMRGKDEAYTKVVDGSLREAAAAAGELGGDIGIIPAGGDRWGLMAIEESKADEQGPGEIKLSNPPIRFAAVTSRDGDTWVRAGEDFVNRGAATAIAASSIDPANASQVASLAGMRLATTANGQSSVELGAPLLGGQPAATKSEMASRLFEAGVEDAVLVDTGRGVLAYGFSGNFGAVDLVARGTQVHPVDAVTLLSSVSAQPTTRSLTTIGGGLQPGELEREVVDVTGVKVADVGSLVGRRIAGHEAGTQRLGNVLSTHEDTGEAITAAAASGARTLVVKLADGAALFALPGKGADPLTTALGGGKDALQVVQERKRFAVASDGSVRFAARSVPFDVKEPIGSKLDSGSVSGAATKLLGSYADRSAALAAIRGTLDTTARYAVVEAAGPAGRFHAYELGGNTGKAWDTQLGSTTIGAWRNDHVRKTIEEVERKPSTWGTDLHYFDHVTERTVRYVDEGSKVNEVATSPSREVSRKLSHIVRAFDPHEAQGHSVNFGGRGLTIGNYVQSTNSEYTARSFIDRSAGDSSAFVVLERENNRGRYHIYTAHPGGYGSSWNESRADAELASWVRDASRTYEETERRSGQHGFDVYHYDITEQWRERIIHNGFSGSVTDRTSPRIDRDLDYIDYADPPPPTLPTGPGDDNGSGGPTGPGDDDGPSWPTPTPTPDPPRPTPPPTTTNPGDSTDNGNPDESDF